MKTIIKTAFTLAVIISCANITHAQDTAKIAAVKNAIANRHYSFEAQSVFPQRSETKQLNIGDYDLQVKNDSVISYLPYYGRAYIAPVNPDDAAIKFTSIRFDYNIQPKKKGGWMIVIKPKDVSSTQELDLSVSETGYASLTVASNDRETISFNGYIKY
jgi:hypothetical protein